MDTKSQITIYTDGACRGNPGPGGYGAILRFQTTEGKLYEKELSGGFRSTTNNRMELLGVITALEALKRPCSVDLYSDSSYVVKAFTDGWLKKWQALGWYKDKSRKERVKNEDLWKRLLAAMEPHDVQFHWVKGHAQNAYNNRCDELAVAAALNRKDWGEDRGAK